jgi:phosphoglycerol transferase
MMLSLGGAVWALRLWRGDLRVPLSYDNDGQFYAVLVKEAIHGWYFTNSQLGAPFGSQLFDFPQGGDQLHFLTIKAMGLFSSDWALVMNAFFLLGFPLAALSAYAVMRTLGVSRPTTTVASALFALLPYHFWHGEFHLFLSAYYAVPLGCYLVIATYRGEPLFARRPRRPVDGITSWTSRRSGITLLMCCAIGSTGAYYAAFTIALLVFAAATVGLIGRSWRRLARGLVPAVAICAVVAINLSPTLLYRAVHGSDPNAFIRTPAQSRSGSLKPADLVLPLSRDRIAALGELRRDYSGPWSPPERSGSEGESATLGVIGSLGLAWLAVVAVAAAMGTRRRLSVQRLLPIAAGGLSALLFATFGGIAIAYLVTPDIRQWVRLSIFIGFFSLLAVALGLDAAGRWLRRRPRGAITFALLLGAAGAVGLLDQTSSQWIPPYRALGLQYRSDGAFIAAIERRLPTAAMVFQLPYMPWAEPGFIQRMTSYTPARGYLHSQGLRWSYGGMRGRPADWQSQLAGKPPRVLAAAAAAVGFDGIYIDRFGYRTGQAPAVVEAFARLLDAKPLISPDRRFVFFDIRGYVRRLRLATPARRLAELRYATLHPVVLDAGAGARTHPPAAYPIAGIGVHGPVTIRRRGLFLVRSPSTRARTAYFTALLSTGSGPVVVSVRSPGAATLRLVVATKAINVCEQVRAQGDTAIAFDVAGTSGLRVVGATVTDAAYRPFMPPGWCATQSAGALAGARRS